MNLHLLWFKNQQQQKPNTSQTNKNQQQKNPPKKQQTNKKQTKKQTNKNQTKSRQAKRDSDIYRKSPWINVQIKWETLMLK